LLEFAENRKSEKEDVKRAAAAAQQANIDAEARERRVSRSVSAQRQ
jgi:hypothetical protein